MPPRVQSFVDHVTSCYGVAFVKGSALRLLLVERNQLVEFRMTEKKTIGKPHITVLK